MTVDATTSSTAATSTMAANPAGYTARVTKKVLDSDDFMKLLSAQMANQDPLKPMEDTAFIAQMTSFSSLAQMNQLTKDFTIMRSNQAVTAANAFIGRNVTVNVKADGSETATGTVTGVDITGDEPKLHVNGTTYPLSSVVRIETGIVAAPGTVTVPDTSVISTL